MVFLAILVLLSALVIASCAAYFSIVGLTLLFIGSTTSIIVMGSALELGKLVAVSFLHQQWEKLSLFLRTYLILASIVLSAITSVGIYGFLASGYNGTSIKVKGLEQTIESNNKIIAQLQTDIKTVSVDDITEEVNLVNTNKNKFIEQQLALITQKEKRITDLQAILEAEKSKSVENISLAKANLESETKKETEQISLFNDRLVILDKEVQVWMDQGTGGLFKQNGLEKARQTKLAQEEERNKIDEQIKLKQTVIKELREEYTRKTNNIDSELKIRIKDLESKIAVVEQEITKDKQAIDEYQAKASAQIAQIYANKQLKLEESKNNVKNKEQDIQKLQQINTELQSKIIETDVGTFKFVAKSVGLELDQTVNFFIWSIMFVFDPLAVTLIICFNHLIKHRKRKEPATSIVKPVFQPTIEVPVVSAGPVATKLVSATPVETFNITVSGGNVIDDDDNPNTPNQYERLLRIAARQRGEK